jgi:hypothetical protein
MQAVVRDALWRWSWNARWDGNMFLVSGCSKDKHWDVRRALEKQNVLKESDIKSSIQHVHDLFAVYARKPGI